MSQSLGTSSTFSGSIRDGTSTIGLTWQGLPGTLTLTGSNTYTGPTEIGSYTLKGGAPNTFSAASPTFVGGTLDLGGFTQTINNVTVGGGGTIQNGSLVGAIVAGGVGIVRGIGGPASLTAIGTVDMENGNSFTGPTVINSGGLMIGLTANAFSPNSPMTVSAGGTLRLTLGFDQTVASLSGDGLVTNHWPIPVTLTNVGASSTFSGLIQDTVGTIGLTQDSTVGGTLTLSGANTYSGPTTVAAGTLKAGAANALSAASATTVDAGGALDLGGFRQTVSSLAGAGTVTNSGTSDAVLTNQGPSSTFSGSITDGATHTTGLTENSAGNTLTLSGTNTYSGPTTVEAGSSILATGRLNLTATNSAAAAIVLQGNGASILATGGGTIAAAGDAIEFLGGTNQTATFDSFDISTQSGDIVFADPSNTTITFNNSTVNAGTGYLLDATAGSTVNFNANASTLTGAMATDAVSTSNVNLTNGTVWNLTGPSNVSSLAVTNSAIVFAPPGAGGFKTLTVGNYVGSGANITLNTALGGSSSPTDQIVVNGGTATGLTYLTIRNAGGLGAQTTGSGIPVVVTTNGGTTAPNAFALANPSLVVGDYRYSLVDPGGDWYLVSQPTPTQQQVQSSLNAVTKAQLGQIVNNGLLSSILLGATQQVSCSNCASGFGALGSFALGTQGRVSLSDRLTAIGGFSYNQWNSSGISVYDAPTVAGALLYDFDNFGSSRPFVEAGGSLTPYESVHGSRPYQNGPTIATGSWTSLDRNLSLFARAGWLARLTPTDEVAAYADFGRNWLDTGGYTEAATALNPYPASVQSGLQALNAARLGGQWTHLFGDNIEVNVSGAVARGFGTANGSVANVTDFGPIGPTGLPTSTWFEYGARIGYRVSDRLVVDAFVLGAVGGEVPATAHGGIALRVAF